MARMDKYPVEGDVILLENGAYVETRLPLALIYKSRPGVWDQFGEGHVEIGQYGIPSGHYVVHAINWDKDLKEMRICCIYLKDHSLKVEFWAERMNLDINIVGKASLQWSWNKRDKFEKPVTIRSVNPHPLAPQHDYELNLL